MESFQSSNAAVFRFSDVVCTASHRCNDDDPRDLFVQAEETRASESISRDRDHAAAAAHCVVDGSNQARICVPYRIDDRKCQERPESGMAL